MMNGYRNSVQADDARPHSLDVRIQLFPRVSNAGVAVDKKQVPKSASICGHEESINRKRTRSRSSGDNR